MQGQTDCNNILKVTNELYVFQFKIIKAKCTQSYATVQFFCYFLVFFLHFSKTPVDHAPCPSK